VAKAPGRLDDRWQRVDGLDSYERLDEFLTSETIKPTPAQLRVLELVALGLSSREIAARLWVSRQTVTYHISNLLVGLRASTRAGLVARAYAFGLLEPGRWPPRVSAQGFIGD